MKATRKFIIHDIKIIIQEINVLQLFVPTNESNLFQFSFFSVT